MWCDLTELLGGEKFWSDIPEAIDGSTFRFLFASTLESNRKTGTLRELDMAMKAAKAHEIKDFIIPLKVDAFPYASTQAALRDRNFVRFDENWATGLKQLLQLLEREQAPRTVRHGADTVSDWYGRTLGQDRRIVVSNEKCYSNWFRLTLPETLFIHSTVATPSQLELAATALKFPHRLLGPSIIAFADADEVRTQVGEILTIHSSRAITVADFIADGDSTESIQRFDARNFVSDLIRQAWEAEMGRMEMCNHLLASGLRAWFFRESGLPANKAFFAPPGGGRRTYRQLVGRKSRRTAQGLKVPDGFWHFAVSASPQLVPFPRLVLRHHVIFTSDGKTPWANANRMHKARRGICKNWWNREWRDRLFAMCSALGKGEPELQLPVGTREHVGVSMRAEVFTSPWTYFEDSQVGLDETQEVELVEEASDLEDDLSEPDDSEVEGGADDDC